VTETVGWNAHIEYNAPRDEESLYLIRRDPNGRRYIMHAEPSGIVTLTEMTGQHVEPTFITRGVSLNEILLALWVVMKARGIDASPELTVVRAQLTDAKALADRLLAHILERDSVIGKIEPEAAS
jgi:hypothetical protein